MRVPSVATESAHELFAHGAEKKPLKRWIMQYVPRKYLDRLPPLVRNPITVKDNKNHGLTANANATTKSATCTSSAGRCGSDQHCPTKSLRFDPSVATSSWTTKKGMLQVVQSSGGWASCSFASHFASNRGCRCQGYRPEAPA